jgi:nucleoside-diphosphate-sugar epimerase
MAKFCTAFLEETEPVIFGDGTQSRDFTYVDNAVQANLLACEAPRASGRVFNIGTGTRVNLNEIVAALGQISGKPLKPRYDSPRDGDIRDSQADISHARAVLGYEPTVSLDEGLQRTFDWYRATQAAKTAAKS